MKTKNIARAAIAVGAALALATGAWAQQSKPLASTFSYYSSEAWQHMADPSPVFKAVTYERLVDILEQPGTYMFLFGGEWCGNTQPVIGMIDEVAKEYGVKEIYNFDTKLDSATLQIRDTKNPFANYYVDLVNKYLQNIVTIYDKAQNNVSYVDKDGKTVVANKLQVPFLFVYNKDNRDAKGNPAPIIGSYERMFVWNDFLTDGKLDPRKAEAYKTQIRPLFDAISVKQGGKKVAKLDYVDDFAFYSRVVDKKAGAPILGAADGKPWSIESVTYPEMVRILQAPGTYVILYGGTWCPNTRAVIKYINEYAAKYGVGTIYNFDWRLDGATATLHLRDSKNPYANLYVDVVEKYFPDIDVEYRGNSKLDISYANKDGKVVSAPRLQVPYLFVYNKDHKNASGKPEPILGHIELMYTWEDMQPDYKDKDGNVGVHYKTYTAALDKLFGELRTAVK